MNFMYVTVQFIILEILLGLIFLVILYLMLKGLLKKIVRHELRDIKEPLQVLASYLSAQAGDDPDDFTGPDGPGASGPTAQGPLPASSPEKLPEEPVDIADEFNQLKNTNRISAYNIRVQKIWELYKQQKITLGQYKFELYRLKKEFGIQVPDKEGAVETPPLKSGKTAPLQSLSVNDPKNPPVGKEKKERHEQEEDPDQKPGKKPGDAAPDDKAASFHK